MRGKLNINSDGNDILSGLDRNLSIVIGKLEKESHCSSYRVMAKFSGAKL